MNARPIPSPLATGVALALASAAACSTAPVHNSPVDGSTMEVSTAPVCPTVSDDLISDFAMDNGVHQADGRQGGWYTYADKSGLGTLTPPEGGGVVPDMTVGNDNCSGPGSLHVKAINFTDWGAATGTDFMAKVANDAGAMVKGTYDATKYRGVSFWAKATAPLRFVQVKFIDPYTDTLSPLPNDQWCIYMTGDPNNCSPYIVKFGYGNAAADTAEFPHYADYKIDVAWKRFEILFADTKQDKYNLGKQSPGNKLDVAHLIGMAIQVNSDHSTMPPTANDFEIWVDDVTFIQ